MIRILALFIPTSSLETLYIKNMFSALNVKLFSFKSYENLAKFA